MNKYKIASWTLSTIFGVYLLQIIGIAGTYSLIGVILQSILLLTGMIMIGLKKPNGWYYLTVAFLLNAFGAETTIQFWISAIITLIPTYFLISWKKAKLNE